MDRQAFVTGVHVGGGVSALDAACQADATSVGLLGTYRALVATEAFGATSRFSADGGPWYRTDGIVAIDDPTDFLVGGFPLAPLSRDSRGRPATGLGRVLSGSTSHSMPAEGSDCGGFTDPELQTTAGRPWKSGPGFWNEFELQCSYRYYVYCLHE